MANVTITQLPAAGAITGAELVPVVQNGVTVQTTTAALAGSPVQTQTFLTLNQESTLTNSRRLSGGTGVGLTDSGAQSTLQVTLNAASGSLEAAGTGIIAKTSSNTVAARTMSSSTTGLSVTNGDGVSGAPVFALTGVALAVAGATGTGVLALNSSSTIATRTILGTTSQIDITDGNFVNSPVIAISSDPIVPGSGGIVIPAGTTGQRGASTNGTLRYNTTSASFEGYANGAWGSIVSGAGVSAISFGSTGLTPSTSTTGAVTVAGTLAVASGGTGVTTSTGTTNVVLSDSPVLVTPNLGTPSALVGTNITGTAAGLTAGTVTTNANLTGDVTSVGNATTLATVASAGSTGSSTAIPVITINAKGLTTSITTAAVVAPAGTLSGGTLASGVTASSLTSLGTIASLVVTAGTISTTPSGSTDIANKSYVDTVAQGLDTKASVVAATTVNITLSGTQTVDGIALIAADRCLVKNQTLPQNNGIYDVAAGAWTRSSDMNTWAQVPGAYVFVETGTTLADTGWVCTSDAGGTLGTTAIVWAQFSGAGSGVSSLNFGTTGLTPATATTGAVTVAGTLAIANGGTNGTATPTSNGIVYGTGTTIAYTAAGTTGQVLQANTSGAPTWGSTYAGTVTSVGFTGGIITVATATTTPAFTVAGTSGGIPYFTSTSTWATSTLLVASALMVGGGAGLAPSTVTTGTGVVTALGVNTGTAGAFVVNGGDLGTPSSGTVTNLTGTASININGTVGATTANTGAFTTLTASADSTFSSTGALLISKGTTGQRPTPATAMLRYNTTTNEFEGYGGASPAWASVGGSAISNDTTTATNLFPAFLNATTGTAASIFTSNANYLYKPSTGELSAKVMNASNGLVVNSQTVGTSYTLASGNSAMSSGPITLSGGVVVTIPSGGRWVII